MLVLGNEEQYLHMMQSKRLILGMVDAESYMPRRTREPTKKIRVPGMLFYARPKSFCLSYFERDAFGVQLRNFPMDLEKTPWHQIRVRQTDEDFVCFGQGIATLLEHCDEKDRLSNPVLAPYMKKTAAIILEYWKPWRNRRIVPVHEKTIVIPEKIPTYDTVLV